jgi:hypothetical protein
MYTLTITHHFHSALGIYWTSLEGTLEDSEGKPFTVGEGSGKAERIQKSLDYYRENYHFTPVHVVKNDKE